MKWALPCCGTMPISISIYCRYVSEKPVRTEQRENLRELHQENRGSAGLRSLLTSLKAEGHNLPLGLGFVAITR